MTRRVAAALSERYSDDAVTLHLGDGVAVMAEAVVRALTEEET